MKSIGIGFAVLLLAAFPCGPAAGWSHAGYHGSASGGGGSWSASGRRGGSASGGGGSWSGTGFRGSTASGGGGSWSGHGYRGGSASGGGGSWSGTGAYGGTAYHSGSSTAVYHNTYYGVHYPAYHPPTTVNVYGSSCYSCGGWSTAGAAAAGLAVGAVAGAAIASANTNAAASNAYSAGYAAGSTANPTYAMGAIYATVPAGCAQPTVQGMTYYLCDNTWFQPTYGANGVYYRVVPAP